MPQSSLPIFKTQKKSAKFLETKRWPTGVESLQSRKEFRGTTQQLSLASRTPDQAVTDILTVKPEARTRPKARVAAKRGKSNRKGEKA
jgi:hypothetical protein